jgi:hypothetical protein
VVESSFRPGSPGEAGAYHESVAVTLNGDQITRDSTAPLAVGDTVHFTSASANEMGCDVRSRGTF